MPRNFQSGEPLKKVDLEAAFVEIEQLAATKFAYRGAYGAAVAYAKNDVISYGGGKWLSLAASLNSLPVEGADWTALGGANAAPTGAAGFVYATPAGVAGAAVLRALVASDLPDASTITKGAVIFAADGNATAGRAVLATDSRLIGRAPLVSPAFTGTPSAPTAAPGTNTTQIATMAALKAALDALVAGAPGALDTLNEIAAQLATDENAAAAIIAALNAHAARIDNPHSVTKTQIGLPNVTNDAQVKVADKDATGGVAGLTLFKINFKNALNTFTSFFANSNTAARTYTFQDKSGTIADLTDLALKADLNSAAFTGTPSAPTPTTSDNSTRIATTEHVAAKIAAVVGTAPATLDTLNELAAALGNDANFAATISGQIGLKADASALNNYLAKSGNLAGLADLVVARANLGLGNSATLSVGTAAGTVAAGNHTHSQISNATGNVSVDNAGNVSATKALTARDTAGGNVRIGSLPAAASYGGVWLGSSVDNPAADNYAFLGNIGIETCFNSPVVAPMKFRLGNADKLVVSDDGISINFPNTVGAAFVAPLAALHVRPKTASSVAAIDQALAGQTANLRQWMDSSGNVKSFINATGDFCIKDTANGNSYKIRSTNGVLGLTQI